MSEKDVTKEEVAKMLESRVCPVDGQKIYGVYIVRKGSSRYLRVLHKVDGKAVQHNIGRIEDREVLAMLIKRSNSAKMFGSDNSWIQVLNVLEDYLTIADKKERNRIKRKMVKILEKMQWGEL